MRSLLDTAKIDPNALAKMNAHADTVRRVDDAIATHPVVVVGMAQNPFVKRARASLTEAGIAFEYLEIGSYFSEWKRRLAVKMWSGWPTFPQVFVRGVLVGGAEEVKTALADGTLRARLG